MRAYLGWKYHEAPWSEYYNSTHQTTLDAKLVPDHRIAHQNVVGGGGGGGKKTISCQRKSSEGTVQQWRRKSDPPDPVSDVITISP